jgi:hypothetical protein
MRAKFLSYLRDIGIHYALTYAKYERVNLALCEIWIAEELGVQDADAVAKIHSIYYTAPSMEK